MSTPTISKSTTISIALVTTFVIGAYALGAKFSAGDAKDVQQDAVISKLAVNIDTLTANSAEMKGSIIRIETLMENLTAQNRVTVSKPTPAPRVVVLASQGSTQPITPANQPPQNDPNPQPADPPEQAPILPCTLLPILCNQGRLL